MGLSSEKIQEEPAFLSLATDTQLLGATLGKGYGKRFVPSLEDSDSPLRLSIYFLSDNRLLLKAGVESVGPEGEEIITSASGELVLSRSGQMEVTLVGGRYPILGRCNFASSDK